MTAAGDLLCQILNQSVLGDLSSGNGKSVNNNNEENSHSGNNDGGNDNDGSNDVKNVNGTVAGEEARDINSIEDQANALEQNVRSDKLGNVSNVDNNCTNIIITENESIAANRSGSSSSSKDDEHRDIKIDWVRVAEFALVGGTLHGPMWGTAFR